jgi:hypothetical protein
MLVAMVLIFMGFAKHYSRMAFGEAPEGLVPGETGRWTVAPMLACLVVAAAIGVYVPQPLVSAIQQIVTIVRGV